MRSIISLYKKLPTWFKWLGLVVVASLVGSLVLKKLTPPATPTPNSPLTQRNYLGEKTQFNHVAYRGPDLTPPPKLAIYKAENLSVYQVISRLTQDLGLKKTKDNFWESPDYSLTYNQMERLFSLVSSRFEPERLPPINQTQAINQAQKLINQWFNTSLKPLLTQVEFFKGGLELTKVNSVGQATYLKLGFSYQLDNLPVFLGQDNYPPVSLIVDGKNKLKKLEFKDKLLRFALVKEGSPLSVSQAVNNLNHNNGTVIFAQTNTFEPISLKTITKADLKKVRLEYRVDGSGLVMPYYHFWGVATNDKGQSFKVEVITPAIKK